jgi:CheY-like chemotaxis protein
VICPALIRHEFLFCRQSRELPGAASMTLIVVTGWGQPGDRLKSKEAGFDQHWVKPVDPRKLLSPLGPLPV